MACSCRGALASLLPVAFLAAACSDPGPEPRDAGASPDLAGPAPSGPYVVAATRIAPDGFSTFVDVVDALGPDTVVDPSSGVEVPGIALLYAEEGRGEVFVDSVSNLTLTKYSVEGGALVERGQLGFMGLGFSTVRRLSANAFASPTRAYLVESGTLQLVTWNPEPMTIVETRELSELAPGDEGIDVFVYAPILRDRVAFFPFAYSDAMADEVLGVALVLALDLDDGTTTVLRDEACGDAIYARLTTSGDILFGSGTVNAAGELLMRPRVGASCLRRIPAGELAFDADFSAAIASFVDGSIAGGLVAGPGDDVLVRVLDEARVSDSAATTTAVVAAPAWSWWRVDVAAGEALRTTIASSTGRFTTFTVGDRTFATVSEADFSRTTLIETSTEPPAAALELPGIATGIALP